MADKTQNVARALAAAPLIPPAQQAETTATVPATSAKWVPPTFHGFEPASGKTFAPKTGGEAARCAIARVRLNMMDFKVSIYRHVKTDGKVRYYASFPTTGGTGFSAPVFTVAKSAESDVAAWLDSIARDCYNWRKASTDHVAPPVSDRIQRGVEFDD